MGSATVTRVPVETLETQRPAPARTASRIGDILIRAKLVTREQVDTALDRQRAQGGGLLGEHLIALGFIDENQLAEQLARQFGIPIVDPSSADISPEVLELVPPAIIRKNQILP